MSATDTDVLVSEVGPRDGLQSIKLAMPTEAKHRWIGALPEAGLREIEVGSGRNDRGARTRRCRI